MGTLGPGLGHVLGSPASSGSRGSSLGLTGQWTQDSQQQDSWQAERLTSATLMTAGLTVAGLRFIACGDVPQFCSEVLVEWTEMGVRTGYGGEGVTDGLCDGAWSGVDCRASGGSSKDIFGSISTGGLVSWETTAAGDGGACGSTWLSCTATWESVLEAAMVAGHGEAIYSTRCSSGEAFLEVRMRCTPTISSLTCWIGMLSTGNHAGGNMGGSLLGCW